MHHLTETQECALKKILYYYYVGYYYRKVEILSETNLLLWFISKSFDCLFLMSLVTREILQSFIML